MSLLLLFRVSEWYTNNSWHFNHGCELEYTNATLMLRNKFLLHPSCCFFSLPVVIHCLSTSWMPCLLDRGKKMLQKKQGKQVRIMRGMLTQWEQRTNWANAIHISVHCLFLFKFQENFQSGTKFSHKKCLNSNLLEILGVWVPRYYCLKLQSIINLIHPLIFFFSFSVTRCTD